jgi:HIV Tat-specific factor 1
MNGRHFSGMKVEAYIADGSEKFKKSSEKKAAIDEDEGEESKRLDEFGEWLEEEGAAARKAS